MRATWTLLFAIACEPQPEPTAVDPVPTAPATDSEAPGVSGVLAAHNDVRDGVDVPPLAYDSDLAEVAAAWIEGLDGEGCNLRHDYSSPYGENLYWTSATADSLEVVSSWESEVVDYDYATNSCAPDQMCGHYTQLVWSTTERVGCAKRQCSGGRGEIWMCVYDPAGNFSGQRPY
ncbi:MAG: Fis family transcriptional regulator [Myxococcales bacterium]|nr:Fis family transcriptional regulator [Myxococcales bacterium]MCB9672129.1 hypothetical protein [Alphaproteobacteria bacterium]MCB9691582.1 hypothetical protein [Alphaproteobacteria bacterium]